MEVETEAMWLKSHRMSEATRSLKGKRMASPLKSP